MLGTPEADDIIEVSGPPIISMPKHLLDGKRHPSTPSESASSLASKTSTMPGSGRSAMPYEIGVDVEIERDVDDNAGSDLDEDTDFVDNSLRQRDVYEFPGAFDEAEEAGLLVAVEETDTKADVALRALTESEDYLHFDWREETDHFEGVREEFVGPCGPTFDYSGLTPLAIFKKIWDADIIAHMVRETNTYARQLQQNSISMPSSRLKHWKDTTEEEIWRILVIIMLQSLVNNNIEREYWYPKLEHLRVGAFGNIMTHNRYLLLKRCLHFADNTLHNIMPVVEHLNQQFSSLYLPEQNVTIDESLLPSERARALRVGIKSYELCESRTGYLWKIEVYTGKGHVVHASQEPAQEVVVGHDVEDAPGSATSQIVLSLMRPLFNKGHTLVMNNFYNAPLLSRLLKAKYHTDSMGTLRLNREFVPESLKGKNEKNMSVGEVCFSTTKDLSVIVWLEKSPVAMISTFHKVKVGGKENHSNYRSKPQVVLDYNLSMAGIDHKDQMLHSYPVERVRNTVWYEKLFRRLVNVSIHNALVIYTHNDNQIVGNRAFRMQLAQEVLQVYGPQSVPRPLSRPPVPSGMHLPVKNVRAQRCKLCHAAKVRRTTVWSCGTCKVNLCILGCYSAYHTGA